MLTYKAQNDILISYQRDKHFKEEEDMKNYTEYTRKEINEIVKRGGDDLKKLNQMTADFLDTLELSEKAMEVVCDTDFNSFADAFGGMFTSEEVEEFINENYPDD